MIDEEKKTRIGELKESGLSVKEIAKDLEISESYVKRYSSYTPDKNNELDEKISNEMTNIMSLEGYDYDDEIKPLIYTLKDQASELDITLHDYLNDIKNTMNKFLRLTDTPEKFYYVFCELANNFSLITDHIEAEKLMEAVDNFYNKEIEMEEADEYMAENEAKAEKLLENIKEKLNEYEEKIKNAQERLNSLTSTEALMTNWYLEKPYEERLVNQEIKINNLQALMQKVAEEGLMYKSENQELKIMLERINHDTLSLIKAFEQVKDKNSLLEREIEQVNQENALLERADDQINHLYPAEMENIKNETS